MPAVPDSTLALTPQAVLLLRLHARRRQELFYGVEALGGLFKGDALGRLDQAYLELADHQLMEPTTDIVRFFGDPKRVYRITKAGVDLVAKETAA